MGDSFHLIDSHIPAHIAVRSARWTEVLNSNIVTDLIDLVPLTLRDDDTVFHPIGLQYMSHVIMIVTSCTAVAGDMLDYGYELLYKRDRVRSMETVDMVDAAIPRLTAAWWTRYQVLIPAWVDDGSFTEKCSNWAAAHMCTSQVVYSLPQAEKYRYGT